MAATSSAVPSSRTSLRARERRWRPAERNRRAGTRPGHLARRDADCLRVVRRFPAVRAASRAAELRKPGASRRLLRHPDPDVRLRPADWSPDGQSILVEKSRADGTREIGLVARAGWIFARLTPIDWRGSTAFFSPGRTSLRVRRPCKRHGIAARHLRDGHRWQRAYSSRRRRGE